MGIIRDLARYAAALRDVSQLGEGVRWSRTLETLAELSDKPNCESWPVATEVLRGASSNIQWFDTINVACELFFRETWLSQIKASVSEAVHRQLQRDRGDLVQQLGRLAGETWDCWLVQVNNLAAEQLEVLLEAGSADLKVNFCEPLANLLTRTAEDKRLDERISIKYFMLIQEAALQSDKSPNSQAALAQGKPHHPLLRSALTLGMAPAAGRRNGDLVDTESEAAHALAVIDASLPRSRIVLYNLLTLLKGIPGSPVSGLNYHLVKSLNTIRFLDGPDHLDQEIANDPAEALEGVDILRIDSAYHPTLARPVVAGPSWGSILASQERGAPPTLRRYHELAGDCVNDTDGFRIANIEELLEKYSEEGGDTLLHRLENTRHEAELVYVRRYYKDKDAEDAPTRSASTIATSRFDRIEAGLEQLLVVQKLPGEEPSRRTELALTCLIQAERLEERLAKVPVAAATNMTYSNLERIITQRLADEGARLPTLKIACSAAGRALF
jgi:hypothetical protein